MTAIESQALKESLQLVIVFFQHDADQLYPFLATLVYLWLDELRRDALPPVKV